MRPLVLSIGFLACALGVVYAQNAGGSGITQQVPVGQTFKNFEFPFYEDGKLKWTATATQATGITQNRAEAMNIKIKVYDNDAVSMTVTSPQADIYVNERKMRSSHTVEIDRNDMTATSQSCDFDLVNKKYLLRTNVKVVLKNFDPGATPGASGITPAVSTPAPAASSPVSGTSMTPRPIPASDTLPESPGTAPRNSAPIAPTNPETK